MTMLNPTERAKIRSFVKDPTLLGAVKKTFLDSFLTERKNQDVYVLAASRLAVDFLNQAFVALEAIAREEEKPEAREGNIGL